MGMSIEERTIWPGTALVGQLPGLKGLILRGWRRSRQRWHAPPPPWLNGGDPGGAGGGVSVFTVELQLETLLDDKGAVARFWVQ
jgi:hypothetical protein